MPVSEVWSETPAEGFPERVRILVGAVGGQNTMAELTGVRSSTLGNWIKGKGSSLTKARQVALKLRIPLHWLWAGKGENTVYESYVRANVAGEASPETDRVREDASGSIQAALSFLLTEFSPEELQSIERALSLVRKSGARKEK